MEPMQVGDFGSMLLAREPSGAVFGVWQAGATRASRRRGEPGAYAWAEVFTREPGEVGRVLPRGLPVQRAADGGRRDRLQACSTSATRRCWGG